MQRLQVQRSRTRTRNHEFCISHTPSDRPKAEELPAGTSRAGVGYSVTLDQAVARAGRISGCRGELLLEDASKEN